MREKFTITDLQNVVKEKQRPPACDETMQVQVTEAEDGVAKGIWTIDEKFLNGHRVVMGGFISGAIDIIMAYAVSSVLTDDQGFASIDLDTTFHRPVLEGTVDITARIDRRGRTLLYLTGEARQNGKLVASTVSSVLVT